MARRRAKSTAKQVSSFLFKGEGGRISTAGFMKYLSVRYFTRQKVQQFSPPKGNKNRKEIRRKSRRLGSREQDAPGLGREERAGEGAAGDPLGREMAPSNPILRYSHANRWR